MCTSFHLQENTLKLTHGSSELVWNEMKLVSLNFLPAEMTAKKKPPLQKQQEQTKKKEETGPRIHRG